MKETPMKFPKGIIWLLAVLFLVTGSAFGDAADDLCGRGSAKGIKGDWDGAIADYTKAIDLKPDFAIAYCSRGSAEAMKGEWDGAIADYTKALKLKPDLAEAYYG